MQGPSQPAESDRLVALLERQCELYRKLKALSERQRGMIASDRPDMLIETLQERQAHVTELTRLNQRLSPFRRDWNATLATLDEQTKGTVSEMVTTINTLLTGIIESDQQDGAMLSARKQMVASELSGLSGGRVANLGYARSALPTESNSADLTG